MQALTSGDPGIMTYRTTGTANASGTRSAAQAITRHIIRKSPFWAFSTVNSCQAKSLYDCGADGSRARGTTGLGGSRSDPARAALRRVRCRPLAISQSLDNGVDEHASLLSFGRHLTQALETEAVVGHLVVIL